MGFLDRIMGEKKPEAAVEQPKPASEAINIQETREAPKREGQDAHLSLMSALKNKVDLCTRVAKLKFTGISPNQMKMMVGVVVAGRLLVGLGGGMEIFDTDLISGMDNVDSILQGTEHSHVDFTNLPDGDGGSHVTIEQAEPVVDEAPVTEEMDKAHGFLGEDDLLNQQNNDGQYDKIINAMHHHSGDGVINVEGSETPPGDNSIKVETPQTETSTESVTDESPVTEVPGAETVPTPTPTSETVPTPNSPENLSGPQQDIKDLSGPKHPTRILGGEKYTANYPFHK